MIIFLILGLALVLRLIGLNQSLWLDEAVQAITAQNNIPYIFQEILGDFHPPLYYFLMHYWVRVFGSSEIALRMPSVLFGVGTVWIIYQLGKLGTVSGAIFLATSQFHIFYSQEARMYSMACFLATLSTYYFIKIVYFNKSEERKAESEELKLKTKNYDYFWYFLSTLCLIYTDYYGILILLAQGIYLIIKRKYKAFLVTNCLLLIAYIPWIPMLIKQIRQGVLMTQLIPGWGRLVNVSFLKAIPLTLVKFTLGRITIFNKTIYGLVMLGVLGTLGILGYKFYEYYKNSKDNKKNFLQIILLWFFVPLLFSWLASLFVPNFQPFRLLLILPSFYLILAGGIEGLEGKRGARWVLIGLILLINLISLGVYYKNPYFKREDWKGLTGFLKKQNAVVYLPSETSGWPIKYYAPEGEIKLRSIGNVGEIKDDKIYFINYLTSVFDHNNLIEKKLKDEGYNKVKEYSFNQIPVWEYNKISAN